MLELFLYYFHIGGGVLSLLGGFAALLSVKGSKLHIRSGQMFVCCMLVTATSASTMGLRTGDIDDITGGLLTAYLVSTGWMAARRKNNESGIFEILAFLFSIAGAWLAFSVADSAEFKSAAYIFAGVILFAALLDFKLLLKGGLPFKYRVLRHIWRMCMSMFVATGSFFLGQMHLFPKGLQKVGIVSLPVLIVIGVMLFWVVRIQVSTKRSVS